MTTITITRTITVTAQIAVAVTKRDGWDLYRAWMSPGLIRSNAALEGWKAARAEHRASDVDYR